MKEESEIPSVGRNVGKTLRQERNQEAERLPGKEREPESHKWAEDTGNAKTKASPAVVWVRISSGKGSSKRV